MKTELEFRKVLTGSGVINRKKSGSVNKEFTFVEEINLHGTSVTGYIRLKGGPY